MYNDQLTSQAEAEKQAYAVILGQYSQAVRDKLMASPSWPGFQANNRSLLSSGGLMADVPCLDHSLGGC